MNPSEIKRLEELYSELVDGRRDASTVGELEALLLDREDLQEYYAGLVRTHLLLQCELSMGGGGKSPVLPSNATPAGARGVRVEEASCQGLAELLAEDTHKLRRPRRDLTLFAALAVSVLIALWFGAWVASPNRPVTLADAGELLQDGLMIRDSNTLGKIEQLNRTGDLSGLLLPHAGANSPQTTLCSGSAWMQFAPPRVGRGYLVELPPGRQMDVTIESLAEFYNSLSVVELDAYGRMTGRTLSFTNRAEEDPEDEESSVSIESIGQFSEWNDTKQTKFYLFSGAYQLQSGDETSPWRDSDFRVHLNLSDVLVIGWDDSGYLPSSSDSEAAPASLTSTSANSPLPSSGSTLPDRDFNDIRVVFRFSTPSTPARGYGTVNYFPESTLDETMTLSGDEYTLDVRPGERALLMFSCDAGLDNSMRLVEEETGRVIWRNIWRPRKEKAIQAEQNVYFIRNDGDTVRRYALHGRFLPKDADGGSDDAWQRLAYRVLGDEHHRVVIGYEDSVSSQVNLDWNDVRVDVHWLPR